MKIVVRIGNSKYLLTPEQMETLTNMVMESTEIIEHSVGDGKGYTGWKNNYILRIRTPSHITPVEVEQTMSEQQLNRIRLLEANYPEEQS